MMHSWNSTEAERARGYPCDRWLADADDFCFRAIDVAAPPTVVFRWLCQLRVAPYSYDWIDNRGQRSPRELTPGLDELEVGQRLMRIFRLVEYQRDRHLTAVLDRPSSERVFGAIAVSYEVVARPGGARILVKLLIRRPPGRFRLLAPLLPTADAFMMRKQLRTLKRLAEGTSGSDQQPLSRRRG